ncbi:MAG: MFS transporter [Proteobacteria bacterium]|nr:MFS transporter [Pseudomonadota bacterium]
MPVAVRLAAYYFAFFAHAGAFVTYFSLYLASLGLGAGEIAFAVAMPQAARIVAPALWGWLADTWGARYASAKRVVLVFSACAMLAGFAALLGESRPAAIALTLLALSLCSAGAAPLIESITFSALQGRMGLYGPIRLWGSIGFILSVLGVGAWLDGHEVASLLPILVGLAAGILVASLLVPRNPPARAEHAHLRFGEVLRRPGVAAFFGASLCMTAAHGTWYVFFSIHLANAGYSKTMIGALWTVGVLAEIVLFLRLPQLLARFSLRALLLASFGCAMVRFIAIGWGVESLAVVVAAQLLHAFTFGAFHSASVAAVHRLFPGPVQARGQALFSSLCYGVGGMTGSLVAGITWQSLGPALRFGVGSLFALLGAALVACKVRV